MPPRRYRQSKRARMQMATRHRILEATAKLHAEHGALGTSFAMIAQAAGVSPQTVYNHFPDLGRLVQGCTSHVQARAPAVGKENFARLDSAEERLAALVRAVYAQLEYLAPWLRLGRADAESIPELAEVFAENRANVRSLIADALGDDYEPSGDFLDLAISLLDYPTWQDLTRQRSSIEAAALVTQCLIALLPELSPFNGDHS